MHLYDLALLFVLIGLVLYVVLAGADFGAGWWQLTAGRGEKAERVRELAHDSIAPVWEANHVWLVFVLTVMWTAYPKAFGSIASTLGVPLFLAALGIIARGALYALRTGTATPREQRRIDTAFGLSSLVAPFCLGACVGAIASGRVPVGNATGGLFSSWLNPTSIAIGVVAVATGAYLAAVFLAADARRRRERELEDAYRTRALAAGVVAGAVAVASLVALHADAHPLYRGLVAGDGLVALIVSGVAGLATLSLVAVRRFEPARYAAALAVTAVVAGWALAQKPQILPGLSIREAAASHDVQVAVLISVIGGAVILFPSLALLFRLALGGRLGEGADTATAADAPTERARGAQRTMLRLAIASLIAGFGLVNVAESTLAHGIGAVLLVAFVALAFFAALPDSDRAPA